MVLYFIYFFLFYLLKYNFVLCLIRLDFFKDFFYDLGIEIVNVKSGLVVGGKLFFCFKLKDFVKVIVMYSEFYLLIVLDDVNYYWEF